jgi:hypothetical protein
MTDMGAFFEPPRRANKKRWEVMKILADSGLRFNTKDSRIYIQSRILQVKNPRAADVLERIKEERLRKQKSEEQTKSEKFN